MKKHITFLLLFISPFPLPLALAFQRTDKMPTFFMPKSAVSTVSSTEKSPLAERVRRQEELRREQEALRAAQENETNEKTSATPNTNTEHAQEKTDTGNILTTASEEPKSPTPLTIDLQTSESTPAKNAAVSESDESKKEKISSSENLASDQRSHVLPTAIDPEQKNNAPKKPTNPSDFYAEYTADKVASYKRIKEEHVYDINLISSGRYTENPRLKEVLADFKDEEHLL
ncbi:MAG: hypothetical protein IJ852_04125 [Alphaproteobacteria bacterium]|nr:hypothetical protein [Alphaproteobacteria bacterium]